VDTNLQPTFPPHSYRDWPQFCMSITCDNCHRSLFSLHQPLDTASIARTMSSQSSPNLTLNLRVLPLAYEAGYGVQSPGVHRYGPLTSPPLRRRQVCCCAIQATIQASSGGVAQNWHSISVFPQPWRQSRSPTRWTLGTSTTPPRHRGATMIYPTQKIVHFCEEIENL